MCDKIEDTRRFVEVMKNFDLNAVYDTGCFVPNCETSSWQVTKKEDNVLAKQSREKYPNMTAAMLSFQQSVPVEIREYSISYGFSNFVADFGGYLGLLLGASLLSIYDDLIEIFIRIYKC